MNRDIVFGKNAVIELLNQNERNVNKIILSKGLHADSKIDEIVQIAKERRIVFQFVPKEKFKQYSEFSHQGVIAFVAPIEYMELEDFLDKNIKNAKLIMLDGVEDPHNLGAIIRTAVCAGFDGIILQARRNSLVTSTVEKISAGAINHISIIKVNNLNSAIEKLKKYNYWIIATDAKGKDNYFDINYKDMNFVIVMGSEQAGVSNSVVKNSDFTVKIPMFNNFNSLNVSNAASIIIYESIRQLMQK